ncbi:MAG: hypothetical protein ACTILH_05600 [Corynebacterium casei]|uniref:hypothetical protein n=1 Tax=Corynebacterium casei TaxID=160386 RepID=UPI00264861B7|nr:hypothetical protein [Corynebacterium casei]MDN6393557.1 hypothetical protein [Corynebacterium casei]
MKKFGAMCLVLSTAVLSACSFAEVTPEANGLQSEPVRIVVEPDDAEQMVLAEIYRGTLEIEGRDVEIAHSGEGNFRIGCTGQILWENDPARAQDLEAAFEAEEDFDGRNNNVVTHDEMMGAMPTDWMTNDPSAATWCDDFDEVDIPMDIVPIYKKTLLNRVDRHEVNSVTKYITNTDLHELVDASRTAPVEDVVEQWILTSVAGGGNLDTGDAVSDSSGTDSDSGSDSTTN